MGKTARVAAVATVTVVLSALVVVFVAGFLRSRPAAIASPTTGEIGSRQVELTLQTVASIGSGSHPDWVSYFIRDSSGVWRHSTVFHLPAHALVHVTVFQFDGNSGLRNAFWARPRGVVGGTVTIDGKAVSVIDPQEASHTFAVPDLGVSVPLAGIPDDAKNPCSVAPCANTFDHRTISFSFRTGARGRYRWQCFVPCAAGTYLGFGGPMQTVGFMDGYLDVV